MHVVSCSNINTVTYAADSMRRMRATNDAGTQLPVIMATLLLLGVSAAVVTLWPPTVGGLNGCHITNSRDVSLFFIALYCRALSCSMIQTVLIHSVVMVTMDILL